MSRPDDLRKDVYDPNLDFTSPGPDQVESTYYVDREAEPDLLPWYEEEEPRPRRRTRKKRTSFPREPRATKDSKEESASQPLNGLLIGILVIVFGSLLAGGISRESEEERQQRELDEARQRYLEAEAVYQLHIHGQ